MIKNPYLVAAEKNLKKQKLYTKFVDEDLLEVSMSKNDKVFAYLIVDKDSFPGIIISLGLDFADPYASANLAISLMHIAPVAMGEAFYRSNSGILHWGEGAGVYFEMEQSPTLLNDLIPITASLH